MKFDKKSFKAVSFKKRSKTGYEFSLLKYGSIGFKFLKNYRIEYIYLFELKKKLKFFLTLRKKILNKNLWIFLQGNSPVSKKSKNSRMGKGKGSLLRMSCRVKKNMIFMEFLNLNYIILRKIALYFKIKNNLNVEIVKKDNFNIFFKKKNLCYYKIYRQF